MTINGIIRFQARYSADGTTEAVVAQWEGGDIVGISAELLEQADPRFLSRMGDIIHICQYTVKIVEIEGNPPRTYICERVETASVST